ncbi:MAG: DUF4340 domain-containing protein [Lachnospiraceae bacterium]|nr:DUF4340 domain-containing protein [Lachnospiraceae bacterium]MCI9152070.1 DUF4340 domain-containing protein [Lachnospiraceae bacterium]
MERQKKQWIGLLVFVVALGVAFFSLRAWGSRQKEQEEAKKEAETITVASLDTEQITGFSYRTEGQELSFEKEGDTWYYSGDKSIPLVQTMITTMLGNLSDVTADQQITEPEDIGEYGFSEPSNVITVRLGQEELVFTIGMQNAITGQYYLMASGDENVYLTDGQLSSAFVQSIEDLTEEPEEEQK